MNRSLKWWLFAAVLAVAVGAAGVGRAFQGREGGSPGVARYAVINTDGYHLIVTDNAADKLYFYAVDERGKVGDDLLLRGTIDLTEVGKPKISAAAQ